MGGGDSTVGIGGIEEEAVFAVGDDVGDTARVGSDDGTASGHGFEEDKTEGFGAGGEDEGIDASVGAAEFFALEVADEVGVGIGEVLFELGAGGAVADEGEAGVGDGSEDGFDPVDFFFGGEATDVEQ
ncbi:MAG: hypothetical protein RLZZ511_683 [Cyanobacteriota bacterium]